MAHDHLAPRFTIVIPCLNQGAYLERAICSVLDQDYPDLELIVADGGSTDGSGQVIEMYRQRIARWRSGADAGPAAALNGALAHASGEVVGVVDGDGLLLPGTLHEVGRCMELLGKPRWIVGHGIRLDERDRELGGIQAQAPVSLARFLGHNSGLLPAATSFFRREVIDEAGGYDPRLRYAYGYDLACRLLARGEAPLILPQRVAGVRERAGAFTAERALASGREYITAAERSAHALSPEARRRLGRSCDERRRVYAIAEAEANQSRARRLLWARLLRRPWWLADDRYRRSLLHGAHPAAPKAAA